MSDAATITRLREFPLFQGLGEPALVRLAAAARVRQLGPGEAVFRQGDEVRWLHGVLAGGVRLVRLLPDGRERVLHRVRAGRTFAEAAVLSMTRYPATAIATAPGTELVEVGARAFTALVEEDRDAAKAMIASLSTWLVHLVCRVEELTTLSADARIARYLLDLPSTASPASTASRATTASTPASPTGAVVRLPLAKKDLAAQLAITPETLSRVFGRWRDAGVVTVRGPEVTVLDAAALVAAADD